MLLAAFLTLVMERPLLDALRDVRLRLLINRNTRRGENPAIVTATGLRTVFIDGALVVDQHGTVSPVVVAHDHMTLGPSGGRKQQRGRNSLEGSRFLRADVDEHRRAAAGGAGTARHIRVALSC